MCRSPLESSYYDNWKTSPPEPKCIGECVQCGGEIYYGDAIFKVPDGMVHAEDDDCFLAYAKEAFDVTLEYAEPDVDWRDDCDE